MAGTGSRDTEHRPWFLVALLSPSGCSAPIPLSGKGSLAGLFPQCEESRDPVDAVHCIEMALKR